MKLKYKIVKAEILKLHSNEEYKEGDKLPTEFELMETYGFSRNTIRQALTELESEGWIYRVHGKGSFFKERSTPVEEIPDVPLKEKKASGLVGVVNFNFHDYIYPEIMRGIEDTIYKKGYSLIMANCNRNVSKEIESVQRLVEQGVQGLILEPSKNSQIDQDHPLMKHLRKVDIPVVMTHWNPFNKHFSMVTINDRKAGSDAADYLIKKGHKRIAIIYKKDVQAGILRLEGYKDSLIAHGIPVRDQYILPYSDEEELSGTRPAYRLTQKLFTQPYEPPTAIFYFNDQQASVGYEALKELGKNIPRDISVMGFDDIDASAMLDPALTTFEHPKYILGRWAANLLLEEMDSSHRKMPMKLLFEPVFIERDSVADLNS